MASIRRYFRNALIGLATMILASLSVDVHSPNRVDDNNDDDSDLHMFI